MATVIYQVFVDRFAASRESSDGRRAWHLPPEEPPRGRDFYGGDLDGIVVARAGLARIGRLADVTETLEPVQMLPAPAQGALAVECRADDTELAALLAELDDADTRAAVTAERALLAELEAGCSAPVGAIAEVVESIDEEGRVFEELSLRGCVAALDGSDVIRASGIGSPERARELGLSVAAELFELGARDVLAIERSDR